MRLKQPMGQFIKETESVSVIPLATELNMSPEVTVTMNNSIPQMRIRIRCLRYPSFQVDRADQWLYRPSWHRQRWRKPC